MKLFILGFYLVLVLTYLEDGRANRTWGQRKATNTGGKPTKYMNSRSRPMKTTATKSSTFSQVSLPNKSYSRTPQISQPRLDKVQFDPKKVSKPGQGRKPSKQTSKMTTINKQKVADIKASLRKMFANKKSGINKQNDNMKVPSLKRKTNKTTQDIKSALNKYLRNNKSNKLTPNLKNTKTNSHSSIASALRSFVTKQKGVNTGSRNKPRILPRRICKRSASGSDCVLPNSNEDAKPSTLSLGTAGNDNKTPTSSLKTEEVRRKYLTDKGIKFDEAGLLGTVEKHGDDPGPDVIFLEKGTITAGLTHILEDDPESDPPRKGHREHFKTSFGLKGSNNEEIDSQIEKIILKAAATKSVEKPKIRTKTDDDGKKQPAQMKMVKEVEWNGETKRINLAIGSNGFIVSAYPASSEKSQDAPKPDTQPGNNGELSKKQQKRIRMKAEQKARIEANKVVAEPNVGAGAA